MGSILLDNGLTGEEKLLVAILHQIMRDASTTARQGASIRQEARRWLQTPTYCTWFAHALGLNPQFLYAHVLAAAGMAPKEPYDHRA